MLIASLFGGCEALNYKVSGEAYNPFFIKNNGLGYIENEQSYFKNHYAMKHLHNKSDITCKPNKITPFVYGLGDELILRHLIMVKLYQPVHRVMFGITGLEIFVLKIIQNYLRVEEGEPKNTSL